MSRRLWSRREVVRAGAGAALAAYGLAGCTVERQVDRSGANRIVTPQVVAASRDDA